MAKITAPNEGFNGEVGDVQFTDGTAETDNQAVIAYCRAAGYTVDGETREAPVVESPDPRDVPEPAPATLRDAAVDPRPEDFLAPTNAGKANPHGPDVVSPEIHASQGVRPVKPGEVHTDDVKAQDAAESEHTADPVASPEVPAGNASKEAWHAYALSIGISEESLEDMGRDEIRTAVANVTAE